ncbi:hypothetical protein [Thermogemmatispora sp.]|uniref:hypothetical protein n=1 Tax=Thermogemmatispora sp. TaxID=1968838 RepID=UPI0035E4404C
MRRREALSLLVGSSGLALVGSLSLTGEETLTLARPLVGALWRASETEAVTTVVATAEWLLGLLERAPALVSRSQEAAHLAAEIHLIAAIAARHRLRLKERLYHLQQAEHYAHLTGDVLLQRALPYYEGYSYLWTFSETGEHQPQAETALSCFQRGLASFKKGPVSPALEASLLTGLAETSSLLQQRREAASALAQAEASYALVSPQHDPGYALADRPPYAVPLCRARVLLNLGQAREALSSLEESQRLYKAQWPQTNGRGLADIEPKRAAVALALVDQELFVEALGASIEGVQRSGSHYGQAEVKQLLRQGQARWPQARQLAELADRIEALA